MPIIQKKILQIIVFLFSLFFVLQSFSFAKESNIKKGTFISEVNAIEIPQSVNDYTFLNFTLNNDNAKEIALNRITVSMDKSLADSSKVSDIKLWDEASSKSFGIKKWSSKNNNAVIDLSSPIKVAPNASKTLKVTADITNATVKDMYRFFISDMQLKNLTVKGLPYYGSTYIVSSVTKNLIGCADKTASSPVGSLPIGIPDFEVGKFQLSTPSNENVTINSIKLSHTGSILATDIVSVQIWKDGTILGSSTLDQNIVFNSQVKILANTSDIFTVKTTVRSTAANGKTYTPTIASVSDINAIGDKYNSSIKLDSLWTGATTFTTVSTSIKVTGIGAAENSFVLQSARDFKLGTVFIKNNNTEDISLKTLKLNLKVNSKLAGASSLVNLNLISSSGVQISRAATLSSKPGSGSDAEGATTNGMTSNYKIKAVKRNVQ